MYQLWDRGSGNRLGEFHTEGEALETVRVITEDDPASMDTLVMLSEDDAGHIRELGAGAQLAALVEQHRPAAAR